MKIVITGSRGFIGRNLIGALLEQGHEVIELDIGDDMDITNWDQVKHVTGFQTMIHLAAKSFIPDSYDYSRSLYTVNIQGTLHMLELCRLSQARFIFISSYVYGEPHYLPIDEQHPTSALNPYAQSKLVGEDLCRAYARDFDVPCTIVRPANIYGPDQSGNFLIPKIHKQAIRGKIELENPKPKRDFLFIDDFISFLSRVVTNNSDHLQILNAGSGISTSVREIVDMFITQLDREIHVKFTGVERQNEIMDTCLNIQKAQKLIDWIPKTTLSEGLRRINEQS